MSCNRVAIIGGGNLGAAVAEGILKMQVLEADKLYITRRRTHQLNHLKERGVNVLPSNVDAAAACDLIILAIKPYQVVDVIKEIKPALTAQKTLVSLVSGVSSEVLQKAAGSDIPVFRAMPNTAIGLGQSMTCISFDKPWADRLPVVEELFNQLGETAVINEELITAQTMKGASELILSSKAHPEREIDRVTTPMGITISGLNEMEHQGFSSSLIQGLITSYRKIEKSK
jgi:pyrroline-5-carboxylate reductase